MNLYRLKEKEAFQQVYRDGRSFATPLLILRVSPNALPYSRCGYSTSKRIGTATTRNRIKRRLREAVRLQAALVAPGWDMVLIAREAARTATWAQLIQAVDQVLAQARLRSVVSPSI